MSTGPESIPPPNDVSPLLPEKFLGLFRPRRCGIEIDSELPAQFKVTLNLVDLDLSLPVDPMPTGVKAGVQVFRDEAVALYSDPAADPINVTPLKDLTNQLAEDFFWWQSVSLDYVYIGMVAVVPVAIYDYIEFTYDDNIPAHDDNQDDQIIELVEDRMRPNCYTRINSEPWNGYPAEFQHWDQDSFSGPCIDSHDRTPGLLMLVPGANSDIGGTGSSIKLAASVLTLEDGRLNKTYDKEVIITCGCSTTPPCGQVCVTLTGCGDLSGITVTARTQPIDHVTITSGGTGYTSPPGIIFSTTNGNSGAGTAVLDGSGHVVGVTITNGGAYTGPVTLTFNNAGHGGSGAAGTVVLAILTDVNTCIIDGIVTGVSISNSGSGYSTIAPITVVGGGGTGLVLVVSMRVGTPITLVAGGSGYAVNQVINLVGGTFTTVASIRVTAVAAGTGAITAVSIQAVGVYQVLPTNPVSIAGGTTGTGALLNFLWAVSGVAVNNGGTGFISNPTVTFGVPGSTGGVTALGTAAAAFKCCLGVFVSGRYSISTDACTPASTLVTVTCPANTNVTIAASGTAILRYVPCGLCPGVSIGGAIWTVSGLGCVRSVAFVSNPGLANCDISFSISRPGNYTLSGPVSPCYQTNATTSVALACSGSVITPTLIPKTYDQIIHVTGCAGLPLAGAVVVISGTFYGGTQTTDSTGNVTFTTMPADCDFTLTITHGRFIGFGPIPFHSGCFSGASTFALGTPIAGYVCTNCVAYPLPTTMFGADSEGTFILIYRGGKSWTGCHSTSGKTIICLSGSPTCIGRHDGAGHTIFASGPDAVVGWTFDGVGHTELGVPYCDMGGAVPTGLDDNNVDPILGNKAYPIAGCCFDSGDIGAISNPGCGETDFPCTTATSRFCGATVSATRIGGYPSIPPFHATWSVSPVARLDFPTGTVTVTE